MDASAEKIWGDAREVLRQMINPEMFKLWFAPLRPSAFDGNCLTLEVANDFCEVWLKDNYLDLIRDVIAQAFGQSVQVRFKVSESALATPQVLEKQLARKEEPLSGERNLSGA